MIDLFLSVIQILCFKLNEAKQDALEIWLLGICESQNGSFVQEARILRPMLHFYLWPELTGILHYSSAYKTRGCIGQRIEEFSVWGLWAIDLQGNVHWFESVWALVITVCVYTAACVAFLH